ncbi:MAG: flagellar hook-basal body complex protein FliE [Pseudomonadota bacterium]
MIEAIASVSAMTPIENINTTTAPSHNTSPTSFMDFVSTQAEQLNQSVQASGAVVQQMALGENVSLHDAMIQMQQTQLHMQLAVEVRNRVMEAYQEVMRMQL